MSQSGWTFLSNHGHVLLFLAQKPDSRLRDVAETVGITERAVQKIVADLADDGYLEVERVGRRNRYSIVVTKALRHPVECHKTIGDLISIVLQDPE